MNLRVYLVLLTFAVCQSFSFALVQLKYNFKKGFMIFLFTSIEQEEKMYFKQQPKVSKSKLTLANQSLRQSRRCSKVFHFNSVYFEVLV